MKNMTNEFKNLMKSFCLVTHLNENPFRNPILNRASVELTQYQTIY